MSNRQLIVMVGATAALALALAWAIEAAQVRRFMREFEAWAKERNIGGASTN